MALMKGLLARDLILSPPQSESTQKGPSISLTFCSTRRTGSHTT